MIASMEIFGMKFHRKIHILEGLRYKENLSENK